MRTIALCLTVVALAPAVAAAPPVLLFSDLDWGPKTGWEGSATKGAAVSVWGLNFGGVRGTSYVTVNGVQLTSDTDYAEWGVTSPARGLQRITFWLKSACQDGLGSISVTVGGVRSNAVPFTVAPGAIYFIAPSGSNSNSGTSPTSAWRDILMFNPGLNPARDGQYIVYVRAGTYTAQDVDSCFVALRGPYGGPSKRKALVGYPGETPTMMLPNNLEDRGLIWSAKYGPYGRNDYFTFAKLRTVGGTLAYGLWGDYLRVIGNSMEDMRTPARAGVLMVDNSQQVQILGNLFRNCGDDSNKHNIYIKTHMDYIPGDKSVDFVTVGWNEFDSPYAGADNRGGAIFISRASDSGSKYVDHVYIHSNYFHGGNMEFIYTGDTTPHNGDVWVYNNVLRENTNGAGGMFFAWGTRYAYVYNNTCYGLRGEGMVAVAGSAQVVSRNNIYRSTGTSNLYFEAQLGATFNSQNDLYFGSSIPSGGGITVSASKTVDPQFLSTADLHLAANSPALDAGTSSVSGTVVQSYDAVPRPQGFGYDIGAFERDERAGAGEVELTGYALPQIAFGGNPDPRMKEGNWSTALYFTNTGPATASFMIEFHASDGSAMPVPVEGGTSTSIQVVVSAGATSRIELSSTGALMQGWASVRMPASVKGFGIFRQSVTGRQNQEAVVPLSEDSRQSYALIWDDGGFDTSMAVANPGDTPVTVNLSVRLANGAQIGTGTINLGPKEKQAFVIREQLKLPDMRGAQGSLAVSVSSGKISVLGLRFGPVAFTSMPPAGT